MIKERTVSTTTIEQTPIQTLPNCKELEDISKKVDRLNQTVLDLVDQVKCKRPTFTP